MLTLYGVYRSRASRNLWLLGEIGCAFRHVPVVQAYRAASAPGAMTTQDPAFLALSPEAAIPVLDDDGLVLTESLAINLHIARTRGGDLGPRDGAEDALMQASALHAATALEPHTIAILYAHAEGRAASPEGRAEIDRHAEALRRPLAVLQSRLSASPHLIGGRFTVADINMAEVLRYAQAEPALLAAFPAVDAWLRACQSRPAFRAMWDARTAEPA